MHTAIVTNTTEIKAAFEEAKKLGLRWAAVSNTGLPQGKWRLTFIPEAAFNDTR